MRTADLGDAKGIAALVTQLGYDTTAEEMAERLAGLLPDPTYTTFVAHRSELLGLAGATISRYFEKNGFYARLGVLVVADSSYGQGVGSALVQAVERWAVSQGAQDLVVNSGNHRHEAHSFYERRGFSATGVRFVKQLPAAG